MFLTGILKAPAKSEFYKELYEKCMEHHRKGKNKDKIKYMRILRDMIDKYNYHKYVKAPKYFCLQIGGMLDAFMNVPTFKEKNMEFQVNQFKVCLNFHIQFIFGEIL